MSLTRFGKRKRASTRAILGDLFEEEVINIPTRGPEPPKDAGMYTEARLKEGLLYADIALRYKQRKVSPLAAHCLTLYKATVKAALEGDWMDEEERIALLNTILGYETEIYGTRALGFPPGTVDTNIVDRLAQLRRYVFAVRYGDYMTGVYERLKIPAQEDSTSYFEQLPGWERYWTDVRAEVEKETKSWDLWKRGNRPVDEERIKTTLAISTACSHMGLNFDNTIETIRSLYAGSKSRLLHMPVLQMARSGKWNKLRCILHDDLRDLPVVMPPDFHKSIPALQHIIEAVVDRYFTRAEWAEWNDHDYNWWEPRLENTLVSADLRDARTRPQSIAAERRAVKGRAERKFKQMVSEHSYLQLSATSPHVAVFTGASLSENQRRLRLVALELQKEAFGALARLQKECCQQFKSAAYEAPLDPAVYLDYDHDEGGEEMEGQGSDAGGAIAGEPCSGSSAFL